MKQQQQQQRSHEKKGTRKKQLNFVTQIFHALHILVCNIKWQQYKNGVRRRQEGKTALGWLLAAVYTSYSTPPRGTRHVGHDDPQPPAMPTPRPLWRWERLGLSNSGTSVCGGMVFPIFTKHIPNDYYIHTEASARRIGRCKWREMDKRSLRSQRSVRRLGKEVIDWAGSESVAACLHLRKSAVVFLLARRIAAVVFLLLRLNTRQTEAIVRRGTSVSSRSRHGWLRTIRAYSCREANHWTS